MREFRAHFDVYDLAFVTSVVMDSAFRPSSHARLNVSGFSAARAAATNGWNVVAAMRRPEAVSEFMEFPNVLVARLDVQDFESIQTAIEMAIQRFGHIDVLINNAGFGLFGVFETLTQAKIREQFDVNVFGLMDVTRAILPHFRTQKSGTIVNITSAAGVVALPMISIYCASKFAVEGFSESLSYELASQGILVKLIESGAVRTTAFGKRIGAETEHCRTVPDDDPFGSDVNAALLGFTDGVPSTEEQAATCIYAAATDGTKQLRYVATEDMKPLIQLRRETSEAEYIAYLRNLFGPS